jgi:hypothetical protein
MKARQLRVIPPIVGADVLVVAVWWKDDVHLDICRKFQSHIENIFKTRVTVIFCHIRVEIRVHHELDVERFR